MTSRLDKARTAFTKIYDTDFWGLADKGPQLHLEQRIADLIQDTLRKYSIASVTEMGCGFWNYAKRVDWSGITYNGYDVTIGPVRFNTDNYTTDKIHFHHFVDGVRLAPADLLICKDVLQHLPTDDVLHYLAMYKDLFSYMLIFNGCAPEENLNGSIDYGGYRPLRLDLPPFNEATEVVDEWDNPAFGAYREQVCLLRGNRGQAGWAKTLVRKLRGA